MSGAAGEPQLPLQEGEEPGVAEGLPAAPGVEVGQGQEEVRQGDPLAGQQAGQAVPQGAGVGEGGGRQVLSHARRSRAARIRA